MPSSWSASLRFELQFTGENINLWGDKLNVDLQHVDYAIAGWLTKALTGDYTLTTANAGDDEARAAMIKFTGGGPFNITIPSVSKKYLIWNACSAALLVTTGSGTTVTIDPGAIVNVACDGSNVKEPGYAGLGLKAYIDASVLGATGALPATTGNNGKVLACVAGAWTPTFIDPTYLINFSATAAQSYAGSATTAAITPGAVTNALAEVTLFVNGSNQIVTGSVAGSTLDYTTFINAVVTLSGSATLLNPSAVVAGRGGRIRIIWTGSGTLTLSGNYKRQGGAPTFSGANGKTDFLFYDPVTSSYVLYDVKLAPS